MKLIVGLGNPERKYAKNRHNVGFLLVNYLADLLGDSNWLKESKLKSLINHKSDLVLAKPQTFMNNSGVAIKLLTKTYKLPPGNLFVVHDDLDIKLGEYKIVKGKSPKLHYGIESIDKSLKSKDYWRVRIGVDARGVSSEHSESRDNRIPGEKYVLMNFPHDEFVIINRVIEKAANELLSLIKNGHR